MQRKHIFALIFLGFAISMELVLVLHLLRGPRNLYQPGAKFTNGTLVSTIALRKGKGHAATIGQAGEALPGETNPEAEAGNPDAPMGYPAAVDPGAYPPATDGDHPVGSEPDDSQSPAYPDPADSNPPPSQDDGNAHPPNNFPYPPPVDNGDQPTQPNPTAVRATATHPPAAGSSTPTATQPAGQSPSGTAPAAATNTPGPAATQTRPAQPTPTPNTPAPDKANSLLSVPLNGDAPKLDGDSSDAAWAKAPAVTIQTSGGANHSATKVTLRSVYDGETVYFLLTWADPGQSLLRNPWEKQKNGGWKQLFSPDNQGGDENRYYMDKIALLWPIQNSLPDFTNLGCAGACHEGEHTQTNPYGLMYTSKSGQAGDLWEWKPAQNIGQVDDLYLDQTRYSKDNPKAGLKSDPSDGGGYEYNRTRDGKSPVYMPPNGGDKTGAPGYILDSAKVKLDPKLFKAGERLPSILALPYQGDRGSIAAGWKYKNGAWTLEISRKRVTGSKYDVQFKDLNQVYSFALATFDNTQVRHAFESGATEFRFKQ